MTKEEYDILYTRFKEKFPVGSYVTFNNIEWEKLKDIKCYPGIVDSIKRKLHKRVQIGRYCLNEKYIIVNDYYYPVIAFKECFFNNESISNEIIYEIY